MKTQRTEILDCNYSFGNFPGTRNEKSHNETIARIFGIIDVDDLVHQQQQQQINSNFNHLINPHN